MAFSDAYQSLIDFDLNNDCKKKSEKKDTRKNDSIKYEETKKHTRSKSLKPKEESKKEVINYDIPSRKFGDLYCVLCNAHMNSEQMWEAHINGKRHLRKYIRGEPVEDEYEFSAEEPIIQKELDEETRPIAGLDHICEILQDNLPPAYQCFLCPARCSTSKLLIEHITGLKHQMAFLKAQDPEKYSLVDSSALSKSYLEPIVQDLISKYEMEHGRGKMSVKKDKGKSGSSISYKKSYFDGDNQHTAPESSKYALAQTSKYSPPSKSSRYSPPSKSSRYSPPSKYSRCSPPSKYSRCSPSKSYRCSPPSKSSRYSPPSKSSRYSPPSKSSRHSPSKYSRHSPSKYSRVKEKKSESEWKKVSPTRERSRERRHSDRSLYSDEEKWTKIEPESAYSRRVPTNLDTDSRLEQTNNYSHTWTASDTGKNCNDLRVILEQKKNLVKTSTTTRANMDMLASIQVSSEINNVSDSLLHLIDDMSPEVFLSLALFKLDNMNVKEAEFKLLDSVANKATALALDFKKKLRAPDLKAKYQETLAQNGILNEDNSMVSTSSQNNLEFTQNLDDLIGHYKARKTTVYEDVHSNRSYPSRLMASDQYIDNNSSCHQLNSLPQYSDTQERATFDSEWNQRSSTSLPFLSFSSTPPCIPGLTLTEEPPAQPSPVMSQFAQTAKNIFGNIHVPSTPPNPYQNEDYNRLNYRY